MTYQQLNPVSSLLCCLKLSTEVYDLLSQALIASVAFSVMVVKFGCRAIALYEYSIDD